ncbi:MAG: DNA-binding protein [Aromatoleum sp.]|jgi:hypothetical protein|uniref:DNA-binding protein n=1 Tax=Aromatoleum sp. TaxID=2307007 RepID=UPI0028945C3A|nr:DNA-binding protein [Aromatoleum sp.]MDT3668942.1 DNA-binding protein [Aromatoleum sp.]
MSHPKSPDRAPLPGRNYTTAEFAEMLRIQQRSVRSYLWRHGHYGGIVPIKLGESVGSRLLWPAEQVDALFKKESAK